MATSQKIPPRVLDNQNTLDAIPNPTCVSVPDSDYPNHNTSRSGADVPGNNHEDPKELLRDTRSPASKTELLDEEDLLRSDDPALIKEPLDAEDLTRSDDPAPTADLSQSHRPGPDDTKDSWSRSHAFALPSSDLLNNAAVLAAHPSDRPNPLVFFDIHVGATYAGRLVIELFENVVPRTALNFLRLCQSHSDETKGDAEKDPLIRPSYKGSCIHRIVPRFLIQGGDILSGEGGGACVEDENFLLKHEIAGQLSLANGGAPNSADGAQFFITTAACPHLDDKHVVFGLVRRGLGILSELADSQIDAEDRPTVPITISNCGEIRPGDSLGEFLLSC